MASTKSGRPPNVLWILTDEQRCDTLACYGSSWAHSPAIDRLARRGIRFHNAYTPSPLCVPARTTMLTGKCVHEHGVWSNAQIGSPMSTDLIARFRDAGYATASFGKSHYSCHKERHLFGTEVDEWYSDQVHPEHYRLGCCESDYGVVRYESPYTKWILAGEFPEDEKQTSEWRAVTGALTWLQSHRSQNESEPFFLRVSFNGPHTPVAPPREWMSTVDSTSIDILDESGWDRFTWPSWYRDCLYEYARSSRLTPDELQTIRHNYYAESSFVDSQVGRVLEYLDETGLWDSTVVAFCSDHGTHLGDYGFVQKQTFFEPVARVPFIVASPGCVTGRSVTTPVSTAQILPTFLDFCGLDHQASFEPLTQSVSTGVEPESRPVVAEYTLGSIAKWGIDCPDRLRMVIQGEWKLCYSLDDPSEGLLFQLGNDPREQNNLYHSPEHSETIGELMASQGSTGGDR